LIDRNQLDQADRWLAELKQADPRGLPALELEARLLDLRKKKPELRALLETRSREVPDQIGAVADLWSHYGFAQEAEAAYKAFVARDPKQPERVLVLATFLASHDRVSQAMEVLKKAWTTCRPEQVATAALPVYDAPSVGADQRRQVEAWVSAAVREHPEALTLATDLGVLRLRQGRFDEAEALWRRVLASAPDHAGAINALAWLLALRDPGKAEEAIELIDRAIELVGTNPLMVDTRAVARIQLGQVDRAVEELLTVRNVSPPNPSFALHLAWAYQVQGRIDQARLELQAAEKLGLKVQELDPLERAIVQKLRQKLFPG
jgi:tetratricopeptide (TPR) repeat protein